MAVSDEEADMLPSSASPDGKAIEESKNSTNAQKSKKRKHESAANDELEIDLSLPERLSKKATRKAKKQKTQKIASIDNKESSKPQKSTNGALPTTHSSREEAQEDTKPADRKRSLFGIWIGNLPYHASTASLQSFITTNAPTIQDHQIVRMHMPVPEAPSHRMYKAGQKPLNKGYAYVDFDGLDALEAALKLSEMEFEEGGRRVLVKNAASFEGRPNPAKVKDGGEGGVGLGLDKMNVQKPPSKRVFVGNLAFDTSGEDLERHYGQCGSVVDVHVATFEDSGKCKGFAWVTFEDADAAAAAVRGFVMKDEDEEQGDEGRKKKKKPRKWFVNKLHGREVRVEFAEDAGYRYRKRFGAETKNKKYSNERRMDEEDIKVEEERSGKGKGIANGKTADERRREMRKAGKQSLKSPGQTPDSAKATGAIVEAKGKKITFA